MTPKRVYVAGAISASDPLVFLENIRKGIRVSAQVIMSGHSVFSPFIDFMFWMTLQNNEKITAHMIKESSLDWLEVSDCVVLVPGWEHSEGTKAELNLAKELDIPIYSSFEEFAEIECKD